MNRAAVSRADLVRWAADLDDEHLTRLAGVFGYQRQPSDAGSAQYVQPSGFDAETAGDADTAVATDRPPHREYALVGYQSLKPIPEPVEALIRPPPAAVEPLAPPPPLVPWSRLWPFLRAALGDDAERHRLDVPRLVAAACRLQPLRRLPRLKGRRWAPRGQLLLDLSPRLYPFWNDFHRIKDQILRLRGATGLEVLRLDRGPDGQVQPWGGGDQGWARARPYAPPPAGAPVLIAGDLGCLGTQAERLPWIALGRRLADVGCRPVALTPCPSGWWDPALAGLYFPVTLDRTAHLPPRPDGPLRWPAQVPDLAAEVRGDAGARLLLTLLSACIAIAPPLLRHLRHRLPAGLADAGSEAAAWQHPAFIGGDAPLVPGDPEEIQSLRRAFPATGIQEQRDEAWRLILAQQESMDTPDAVRMEERALYAAILGGKDPKAEEYFDQVRDVLGQVRSEPAAESARRLTAWVDRRARRTHEDLWSCSPSSVQLWLDAHPQAEGEGAVSPPGYDIHRALAAAGRPEQFQAWRLVQCGDRLAFEPLPAPERPFADAGPLVAQMPSLRPVIRVREERPGAVWGSLGLEPGTALPLGETGRRLGTEYEELVIAPLDRPAWAHTLGRDRDGLFVGFEDGRGERWA